MFTARLSPVLVAAVAFLQSCGGSPESGDTTSVAGEHKRPISFRVHVSSNAIYVSNLGDADIDDVTLRTYPGVVDDRLLLVPYSFSTLFGRINKNSTVIVMFDEFTNDYGVPLSHATRTHVGACHILGKVKGRAVGDIYIRNDDRFVASDPGLTWGAITDPLIGPVDGTAIPQLDVDVGTSPMSKDLVVIIINKGEAIGNLEIIAFPALTADERNEVADQYAHTVIRLSAGDTLALSAKDFKNKHGDQLNDMTRIRVLRVRGHVDGRLAERYASRPAQDR